MTGLTGLLLQGSSSSLPDPNSTEAAEEEKQGLPCQPNGKLLWPFGGSSSLQKEEQSRSAGFERSSFCHLHQSVNGSNCLFLLQHRQTSIALGEKESQGPVTAGSGGPSPLDGGPEAQPVHDFLGQMQLHEDH